jgi:hypothetical protein
MVDHLSSMELFWTFLAVYGLGFLTGRLLPPVVIREWHAMRLFLARARRHGR